MSARRVTSIGVFVDAQRRSAVEAARKIARMAADAGVPVRLAPDQAALIALADAVSDPAFPQGVDLMVSLGGDGTLLRAAHLAVPRKIPIVGIDFGRVGFLTRISRSDFTPAFEKLLHEGFEVERRTVLQATANGRTLLAINDVSIERMQYGHTLTFGIDLGGVHVADIPADGIVVSSPTGSTAYFLSAGGPILAPGLDAFGIAPICPHTLFSRPLVVSSSETVRITVPAGGRGAYVFVDGGREAELKAGATIEIARAPETADFARIDDRHFFRLLERKLHWGTSIKRSVRSENGSVARQPR